jgi:uncharacterized phage infection (PIP) family protein YhgE
VSSLKETLSLIHGMAPALPGHLAPVLEHGERVQQLVQEFLHHVAEKRAEVTEHLSQLHAALSELKAGADEQHGQLETEAQAVETALQDDVHALEADERRLSQDVEGVGSATRDLQHQLADAGAQAHASEQDVRQAVAGLVAGVHAGEADLNAALHSTAEEVKSLEHAVEEAQHEVVAELNGFREHLHAQLEQARGRLGQVLERLRELASQHEADIHSAAAELTAGRDQLIEDMRQQEQQQITERVHGAEALVCEALQRLSHELTDARAGSERLRNEVEAQFEELKEAMPPLLRAVESVKRAANEVGITWS